MATIATSSVPFLMVVGPDYGVATSVILQRQDGGANPIDITGWTVSAVLRVPGGTVPPTVTILSATQGAIAVGFTAGQTQGIAVGLSASLLVTMIDTTSEVTYWVYPLLGVEP